MRRTPLVWTVCTCFLLAGTAPAEVGLLKPYALGPDEGIVLLSQEMLYAEDAAFAPSTEGSGCVSPKAVVATCGKGDHAIAVAIDTRQADDQLPNVARIDLTGKGKFADAIIVDLKSSVSPGSFFAEIKTKTVSLDVDGVTQVVRISGRYSNNNGGGRFVQIHLNTVRQGLCKFGDKVYPVRLTDGNNNMTVNDKVVMGKKYGRMINPSGDTIVLGNERGRFSRTNPQALVGCPILVDGVWYDVTVSDNQMQVKAEPVKAKCGTIRFGQARSWAHLVGHDKLWLPNVPAQGVTLPVGTYEIVRYGQERVDGDKKIELDASVRKDTTPVVINVKEGETLDVTAGSPLVVTPIVKRLGPWMTVEVKMLDSAGLQVNNLFLVVRRCQQFLKAPKMKVVDETGKVVHQVDFESAWGSDPSFTGPMPADLKGTFKIFAEYENPPVEMTYEPAVVTLD